MARRRREFGVPSEDINAPYGFQYETAEIPQPEVYNLQRQIAREQAAAAEIKEAEQTPVSEVQWNNDTPVGAIARPRFNTLRGYKYALRAHNGENKIQFAPHDYAIFDGIIVRTCGLDETGKPTHPAFNPDHPFYQDFAPLRRNIAVLRNYLMVSMLPPGQENNPNAKLDPAQYAVLQSMAAKLGGALRSYRPNIIVRWLNSVVTLFGGGDIGKPDVSKFMQAANVPDQGIATMYNYLFGIKNAPKLLDALPFIKTASSWPLLPTDQTPFSEANMDSSSRSIAMEGVADAFDYVLVQLQSPDSLSDEDKRISVEHAENILKKLRIILGSSAKEDELNVFTDAKQAQARMMLPLAMALRDALSAIGGAEYFGDDPQIGPAILALNQIGYSIKNEAYIALQEEGKTQAAAVLGRRMQATPERFKTTVPVAELLTRVEEGIVKADTIRKQGKGRTPSRSRQHAPQQPIVPVIVPPNVQRQQQTSAKQAAAKQQAMKQAVVKGHDTMAGGGVMIHQVSNSELVKPAQEMNKKRPPKEIKLPAQTVTGKQL